MSLAGSGLDWCKPMCHVYTDYTLESVQQERARSEYVIPKACSNSPRLQLTRLWNLVQSCS